MGAVRVFNVDETAIETKREHKRVIAAKGSKNVWHSDIKTHFHLSFVTWSSASGYVAPPLFIFSVGQNKMAVEALPPLLEAWIQLEQDAWV
ncbi:hypothetical protein L917_07609 [Phytophthora nicotianae]|uniref:Tc1-like transposase DDE domain-containing protein n=1 Tax=Phytophthora nicotianae TaxID=4792 RepID=W2LAC9_PHYNI|nr:hypothetical protein L917_07609 [Phytophthora nicotianae]